MRLFAIATLTPVVLIAAACIWGGIWVLAAVAYLSALTAGLDETVQHVTPPTQEAEFPAATDLSVVLALSHFVLLYLVITALCGDVFGTLEKLGIFFSSGFFFGQVSNVNAHELIHRGGRNLHRLGKWVYVSLLFGHHTSAHVLVHHRHAATRMDPSTSRRGESYYRFVIRAWGGSFRMGLAARDGPAGRI